MAKNRWRLASMLAGYRLNHYETEDTASREKNKNSNRTANRKLRNNDSKFADSKSPKADSGKSERSSLIAFNGKRQKEIRGKHSEKTVLTDNAADSITESGTTATVNQNGILPISIIGEIEGHTELGEGRKSTKYEHIIPLIVEAEQNSAVKGVLLILNTMGGDVEAGLALSELIAGISKPTVSLVLGGSHSIGVPLAVSADWSFIAPTATMMVHPIRTSGLVIGVEQSFDYLKRMQQRITDFIIRHSSIEVEELNKLMLNPDELVNDMGSVLIGDGAVKAGLINEVGSVGKALAKLKELISAEG